jgi:phage gpG-like protein
MATIGSIFGQILGDLQNTVGTGAGAARFGRMARGQVYEGRDYYSEAVARAIAAGRPLPGHAALIVTLDKEDFAVATKRMKAYENIPFHTGRRALQKVGQYILGSPPYSGRGPVQRAFEYEQTPSGTEWQELSETQKWYRKADGPILDETGELKAAATSEAAMISTVVTGKYARMVLTPEALEDTVRFKFFTHQLGSYNGWGKGITIPARPFFPDGPEDLTTREQADIQQIIEEGIEEGVRERQARGGI